VDSVLAVERAYVAAATGGTAPSGGVETDRPRALAALGAIASRYLGVGTPRTLGLIIATSDDVALARLSLEAHRAWFAPREVRCAVLHGDTCGEFGAPATVAEALASDIVCVHAPILIRAADLRRGTHLNLLAAATLDDDLAQLATVIREGPPHGLASLGALAAGLVDGRQLDELTVFIAGDAAIALATLSRA